MDTNVAATQRREPAWMDAQGRTRLDEAEGPNRGKCDEEPEDVTNGQHARTQTGGVTLDDGSILYISESGDEADKESDYTAEADHHDAALFNGNPGGIAQTDDALSEPQRIKVKGQKTRVADLLTANGGQLQSLCSLLSVSADNVLSVTKSVSFKAVFPWGGESRTQWARASSSVQACMVGPRGLPP